MTTASCSPPENIAAVVLAAGRSTRMGRPKLLLPWGGTTVIGQVVQTLVRAYIAPIIVVSGAEHEAIGRLLADTPAQIVFNPGYETDSMLLSLQTGLAALPITSTASLVVLGDQPQIQVNVVRAMVAAYQASQTTLIVPSFQMHRGHPWLVARSLWGSLLHEAPSFTMRQFLHQHTASIQYVNVNTNSILQDLDTPEDYALAP